MKLRLATHDDLACLAGLGQLMHAESSYAPMDYDPDRVRQLIGELIDKKQFVVVAEGKNAVVAAMVGTVTQTWFGADMVASDLALFVHPEHRGGLVAARLIKAFVQWAQLAGAKQIRPGVTTGHVAAAALYEKLGFRKCGATLVMEGD